MAKILIVDDEEDIVEMLCAYFRAAGYETCAARSGEEALFRLREPVDLILLDISMPGTDGIEVCKRIREFVSCPILFLTAKIPHLSQKRRGKSPVALPVFRLQATGYTYSSCNAANEKLHGFPQLLPPFFQNRLLDFTLI